MIKEFIDKHKMTLISLLVLVIVICIHIYPILFKGLSPSGTDVIGSSGATQMMQEINPTSRSMWNPAMFSGMPFYQSWSAVTYNFDYFLVNVLSPFMDGNTMYFFIGSFGIFLLLRRLGFTEVQSLFGALTFLFMIHYNVLFQEGHFKKYRTIMWSLYTLYAFFRIIDKQSILNTGLLAIFLSLLFRANHPQVIFYTALFMLFIGTWKVYNLYKEKSLNVKFFIMIILAITLGIASTLQPTVPLKDFAKYSIRGTSSAKALESNISDPLKPTDGLDYDYATNWSFPPSEYMTFMIPRFYGGGSAVYYTGNDPKFRQAKNQQVLGYWGDMTFTASSEYVGIVVVFFALIGLFGYRKLSFVKVLAGFLIFCIFLSFGKYVPILYDLFYYYVPLFNKFRNPMIIIVMINILIVIFATYGLKFITSDSDPKEKLNAFFIGAGITLGITLISLMMSDSLDFFRDADKRYGDNLQFFISIRKAMFEADVQRALLYALAISVLTYLYIKGKLVDTYIYIAIALSTVDLYQINQRYLTQKIGRNYTHLNDVKKLSTNFFTKKKTDEIILNANKKIGDLAEGRVYPVQGNFWNTNEYSYYHQSIGGYDPAKLRIVQDLADYMRYSNGILYRNVVDMLNAKYWIIEQQLPNTYPFDDLTLIGQDGKRLIYLNENAAGRAWFVDSVIVKSTFTEIQNELASKDFTIHKTALLEAPLAEPISKAINDTVIIKKLGLHELNYEVSNDNQSLLVFSEIYFPEGWNAYIDGKTTEIYKTNHVLRSIIVPSGVHKIDLKFEPVVLRTSILISNIGTLLSFIFLAIGIYLEKFKKGTPKPIE